MAPAPQDAFALGQGVVLSSLTAQTVSDRTQSTTTETTVSLCPATFEVAYTLSSDYIFRGMNLSEYAGEGREKPNHQITTDLGLDLARLWGEDEGTCGTFHFSTFFEWYAAQKKLNPAGGGQNLQEVDYTLAWSYHLEPCDTTLTLGYKFYVFPNLKATNTDEWFFNLAHNDAWMWKWLWPDNEDAVLNPTFLFAHDLDRSAGEAIWMELGVSHDFEVCPNVTMTPSCTLGIDHDYYATFAGDGSNNTLRLANMLWGLDVTYDLSEPFSVVNCPCSMYVTGFLRFSDALGNAEDGGAIQDEFYGGVSVGWSFGGA